MKEKVIKGIIDKYWSDQGECASCGWHGSLFDHIDFFDEDDDLIDNWEDDEKRFEFGCASQDTDDNDSHRGARVYPDEKDVEVIQALLTKERE